MNRSPLFYPLSRSSDSDAGGAADLQTDVMRFMALISLCLVAIFALVQSIPLTPSATDSPQPIHAASNPPVVEDETQAPVEPVMEVRLTRPKPAAVSPPPEQPVLTRPKLQRLPARSVDTKTVTAVAESPAPQTAAPAAAEQGFTLRFETDAALTRLVARQLVGLYAISTEQTLRMSVDADAIDFWPASTPQQFHEMDQATVPNTVLAAYSSMHEFGAVKWAVTLPADISSELDGYMATASGGSLIIAGSGQVTLRH